MPERLPNGSLVHRVWAHDSAEFLAAFQYHTDAVEFCKAVACDQPAGSALTAVSVFDGTMDVFRCPADPQP